MPYSFESLSQLKNLRGKLPHDGWQPKNSKNDKTDIAIHHSLTKEGDAHSFSRHHVFTNGWPEIAYHFVILKDGTIQYCHDLSVISYHVGNSNNIAVGICLVGDFREEEPTKEQKRSLKELHDCLMKDMPSYKRTRGHNEFPGYEWKECPSFDYRAVLRSVKSAVKEGDWMSEKLDKGTKEVWQPVIERWTDEEKQRNPISKAWLERIENDELEYKDIIRLLGHERLRGLK
ncbi:peptidoglycan recognition protein family protein [Alteribacillus persepolensis]|nr:peptidoglycan recognition family protein [Alteribacillus persepolensis]